MAFGGQNVGSAYVRITADGSGMDKDIRDMLNDSGDAYERAGNEHSKQYAEAFAKNLNDGPNQRKLDRAFNEQLARRKFGEQLFNGAPWKQFRQKMIDKHKEIGAAAAAALERDYNAGLIDPAALQHRLDNLDLLVTKSTEEIQKAEAESNRRSDQARKVHENAVISDFKANNAQQQRLLNAHTQAIAENFRREEQLGSQHLGALARDRKRNNDMVSAYAENERRNNKNLITDYKALNDAVDRTVKGERTSAGSRTHLLSQLYTMRRALHGTGPEFDLMNHRLAEQTRRLNDTAPGLAKLGHGLDRVADGVAKGFGKGSRNNFLNFIGSVAGGIVKLPHTLLNAADGFGRLRRSMQFAAGETFVKTGSRVLASISAMGNGLGSLAQGFGKIGIGISAGIGLIGPLISILSLAAGVVLALASSIGFALVGAVGALGAVLLPMAAVLGTVAFAFAGLTKAQRKALKVDFKPVNDQLVKLRHAAQDGIFSKMKDTATALAPAVAKLRPLFYNMGKAIGDVAIHLANMTKGAGFDAFMKQMGTFLPNATRKLGTITGQALGGIGGLFRGMIPFMNQVLNYLVRITGKFSDWANSAAGQNSIKTFFTRALNSLKAFGGFLGSVGRLLGTVMTLGRKAGDDMFGSMSKAIDGWTKKIQDNPDMLKNWFNDAKKFGTEVGDLIVGIAHLFDALDTPQSRKIATKVFGVLAKAIQLISDAIDTIGAGNVAKLFEVSAAIYAIGAATKFLTGAGAFATGLRLIGAAGTAAGGGLWTAGAGAAAAESGMAGLSVAALALPAAVAIAGGFATKYIVGLDKIDVSQGKVTASMEELGRTGKTSGFGDVSKSYGAAIPIVDRLTHGLLNLKRPTQDVGEILHSAAYTDMPKIFAPGAVSAVGKMDTALSHMSRNDATKTFAGIVKEGKKAGVSLEDVRHLFPKFTAAQVKWDAASGNIMTQNSIRLTHANEDWFLLGERMDKLPRAVTTLMSQPGMITSLGDIKALQTQYHLNPDKLLTVIAATGAAETIGDMKKVRTEFKLTPEQVTTLVTLTGQVKTLADVNKYVKALNLTPEERTTIMRILGIKEAAPSLKDLVAGLKSVPPSVTTQILALGADATKQSLTDIILKSGDLNGKQIRAIFKAEGVDIGKVELQTLIDLATALGNKKPKIHIEDDSKETTDNWKRIGQDIDNLGKKKATPKILLDNKEFVKNKNGVITGIRDIGKQKAKPKVAMDDTGFKIGARGILTKTKGFSKLQGKPKVGLDDQGFIRNKNGVITGVKGMGKLSAKPKVDLDPSRFAAGKARVGTGMADMGRKTAKPKADLDHSKFDAGRARVGTEMSTANGLKATPQINVKADTSGAAAARAAVASVQGKTVFINIQRRLYGPGGGGPANPGATATGGVFGGMANYAQTRLIGEAGPEAVVPLMRPLSQVDPAVRWLSAIAQGKMGGMASGGVVGTGRTVNIGEVNVITPNTDTRAVAHEVVNKLVAVGY